MAEPFGRCAPFVPMAPVSALEKTIATAGFRTSC